MRECGSCELVWKQPAGVREALRHGVPDNKIRCAISKLVVYSQRVWLLTDTVRGSVAVQGAGRKRSAQAKAAPAATLSFDAGLAPKDVPLESRLDRFLFGTCISVAADPNRRRTRKSRQRSRKQAPNIGPGSVILLYRGRQAVPFANSYYKKK